MNDQLSPLRRSKSIALLVSSEITLYKVSASFFDTCLFDGTFKTFTFVILSYLVISILSDTFTSREALPITPLRRTNPAFASSFASVRREIRRLTFKKHRASFEKNKRHQKMTTF